MSRANIKAIREIRAAESRQFRKKLLKGHGQSASAQQLMTELTAQSNLQYEEVWLIFCIIWIASLTYWFRCLCVAFAQAQ